MIFNKILNAWRIMRNRKYVMAFLVGRYCRNIEKPTIYDIDTITETVNCIQRNENSMDTLKQCGVGNLPNWNRDTARNILNFLNDYGLFDRLDMKESIVFWYGTIMKKSFWWLVFHIG